MFTVMCYLSLNFKVSSLPTVLKWNATTGYLECRKPCRKLSAVIWGVCDLCMNGPLTNRTLFSKPWQSLVCHSAFCVCHWKRKSSPFTKMRTGSHTYAMWALWQWAEGQLHIHTLSFFSPSSLRKRVGQKGAEVARKIREMSETLPTLKLSQLIMTKQRA